MKNLFVCCLLAIFISCDDGDLQIETIDFDSVAINTCESTITTSSTVFFKINGTEALILELQSGVLKNEVSSGSITSLVPSQSKLTYRIFSDKVASNYFCDDIPTTEPLVIEEIEAEAGEVLITTVLAEGTTDTYEHTIELNKITFITSQDQRITDLQINNFGVVTTQP
ncbi:hypothetical protein [Maribacter sp. HTCC2170]|uniref:hypothetical protein n=1 Tax=Maribacter sp. (strain HTCC2170 / KCCM 42371) TaxID=313603 RepID=UPI00006B4917|nr:hypothetical protein [Maribacter sp. HTCC2170]EAR00927.1 hypothetical protein FB2170_09156 [Maribacter sp. HTCC2170]